MTDNSPATDEEVEAALGVSTDNIQGFYHAPKIGPASHVIRDVHAGEELWRMRTADYEIGHAAMMREIERIKMRAILNAASRIRAETAKNSGEVVGTVYTMEALPGGDVKYHVSLIKPLPAGTKLYATPTQVTEAQIDLALTAWLDQNGSDREAMKRALCAAIGAKPSTPANSSATLTDDEMAEAKRRKYAWALNDAEVIAEARELLTELDTFNSMDFDSDAEVACQRSHGIILSLVERLEAPSSKPVAWRWRDNQHQTWNFIDFDPVHMDYVYVEPLYATPANSHAEAIGVVEGSPLLDWAVSRWNAEVKHRPLINVHRRSLDDAWRQIIRWAGGDPVALVGPSHDELRSNTHYTLPEISNVTIVGRYTIDKLLAGETVEHGVVTLIPASDLRGSTEPEQGEHQEVLNAIAAHNSGEEE